MLVYQRVQMGTVQKDHPWHHEIIGAQVFVQVFLEPYTSAN
jgi:hypothetical protein